MRGPGKQGAPVSARASNSGVRQNYTDILEQGKLKEQEFASMFASTVQAGVLADMHDHWDVLIKYDVKALKRAQRSDSEVNENIHYVELVNVNGAQGWLYGKADYFAFEMESYWCLVAKRKLQDFVTSFIDTAALTPEPQRYQKYSRGKDLMTLVPTVDLIYLGYLIRK